MNKPEMLEGERTLSKLFTSTQSEDAVEIVNFTGGSKLKLTKVLSNEELPIKKAKLITLQ